MAKVLLVEDDTNLREIFEMRLQAEGYETLTAGDGEQALVVAMKEKPDLIIADVMMPHLSGFEMLETLRAAPGMADTKVVMMTALGQAEDQARGEKLGVVKYLVKSQVTLEDFARVIREVLPPEGGNQPTTNQGSENKMDPQTNTPAPDPTATPAPTDGAATGATDDAAVTGQPDAATEAQAVDTQAKEAMDNAPTDPPAVTDTPSEEPPAAGTPPADTGAAL